MKSRHKGPLMGNVFLCHDDLMDIWVITCTDLRQSTHLVWQARIDDIIELCFGFHMWLNHVIFSLMLYDVYFFLVCYKYYEYYTWPHPHENDFTVFAQVTILYKEFENDTFKITTTSPPKRSCRQFLLCFFVRAWLSADTELAEMIYMDPSEFIGLLIILY